MFLLSTLVGLEGPLVGLPWALVLPVGSVSFVSCFPLVLPDPVLYSPPLGLFLCPGGYFLCVVIPLCGLSTFLTAFFLTSLFLQLPSLLGVGSRVSRQCS